MGCFLDSIILSFRCADWEAGSPARQCRMSTQYTPWRLVPVHDLEFDTPRKLGTISVLIDRFEDAIEMRRAVDVCLRQLIPAAERGGRLPLPLQVQVGRLIQLAECSPHPGGGAISFRPPISIFGCRRKRSIAVRRSFARIACTCRQYKGIGESAVPVTPWRHRRQKPRTTGWPTRFAVRENSFCCHRCLQSPCPSVRQSRVGAEWRRYWRCNRYAQAVVELANLLSGVLVTLW